MFIFINIIIAIIIAIILQGGRNENSANDFRGGFNQ